MTCQSGYQTKHFKQIQYGNFISTFKNPLKKIYFGLRKKELTMTLVRSTGNFIHPLDPSIGKAYEPKGGSGILEVNIWVNFGQNDTTVKRHLAYTWSKTVNGIEVTIEKPEMKNASALEEDIYQAMKETMNFDHLNFIKI